MRIEYLADHPDVAPVLARWHYAEWKDLVPGWSLEAALAELQAHTGGRQIPTTLVAFKQDDLVASASLFAYDLDEWPQLTPWLGSVFVVPEHRGQGIGKRLVMRVMEEAKALGVPAMFLWTAGQRDFYAKLGWQDYAAAYQGEAEVAVMRMALSRGTGDSD